MQALALARRYRPRSFETLIGQASTVCALRNTLASPDNLRLHHAYLFTGSYGVGKTTIARILAKCLNCEAGISAHPCNICSTCKMIDEGRFVDVIEVDAASRTKVEDTRELLDNVQYLPTQARFKIYIIDEVHMLSIHSFNALLKTLEEPPAHVKFLLATTDPQKLPATIVSRCLQFHLHRLSFLEVADYLMTVLTQEGIQSEREAVEEIAHVADGSMRDALSLLDKVLAYGQGRVTCADVQTLLGLCQPMQVLAILQGLLVKDGAMILNTIAEIAKKQSAFNHVLVELLRLLHKIAVLQVLPNAYDGTQQVEKKLGHFAKEASLEEIQLYYQIGVQGQRDLPYAPSPKIGFEMILLRMLAFQPLAIAALPQASVPVPVKINTLPENPNIQATAILPVGRDANKADWFTILPHLKLNGVTKALAQHCAVIEWSSDFVHLMLDESQEPLYHKRHEERLKTALLEHLGRDVGFKMTLGKLQQESFATQSLRLQNDARSQANAIIEQDAKVQDLVNTFDGKLEGVLVLDTEGIGDKS